MSHEEWQVLVSAYHDGEVTDAERARVEAHLAECAECQALLADCRRLGQAVHNLPWGEPSRELWPRVRAKLPMRRQSLWRRLLPVTSAVAMLVVGITVVAVLRLGQMGTAVRPLMQKKAGEMQPAAVPTRAALASPVLLPPEAAQSETLRVEAPGGAYEGPPCPGMPLEMEVVALAVARNARLAGPQVRGVLYDAAGQPVAGATLVISGTAGWQGMATTAADGTFALDLPVAGAYRLVLGLIANEDQGLREEGDAAWRSYALPDGARCPVPPGLEMAPVTLAADEVAILTLRLK